MSSWIKVAASGLVALCLLGCQPDEIGVDGEGIYGIPGSLSWFSTASPRTQAAYYGRLCQTYGYVWGTPQMANCVASEIRNGKAQATRTFQASVNFADQLNRPAPTSSCRINQFGASTYVNCY